MRYESRNLYRVLRAVEDRNKDQRRDKQDEHYYKRYFVALFAEPEEERYLFEFLVIQEIEVVVIFEPHTRIITKAGFDYELKK